MPSEWQLDCLKSRIKSLNNEIGRVAEKQPAHAATHRIHGALREVLTWFETLLEDARRRAVSRTDRSVAHLEYTYTVVAKELTRVTTTFRMCDRVDSPRIPFEILRSLSHVATSMAAEKVQIVVHLSTEYNYEISSMARHFGRYRWTRWWLEAARPEDAHGDVLLMIFPSYEVGTTLLHAAAAHELGHVLAHRMDAQISAAVDRTIKDVHEEFKEERNEFIEVDGVPKGLHDLASENAWRIIVYRDLLTSTRWIRETFADLVAARLVGPAYLAVLDRLSVGHREDIFHPPLVIRRRVVKKYLRKYLRHVAVDPAWRDVKRGEAARPPQDISTKCGSRICENVVEPLGDLLHNLPTPLADRKTLATEVRKVAERIDNLAPPSLDRRVPDVETVATAFWVMIYATARYRVSLSRFAKFAAAHGWTNAPDVADAALNSLLLISLQNLDVKLRWETMSEGATHAT